MSGFTCPTCLVTSDILPRTSGGAEALCKETGLPLLAKIPLDQQLAKICDGGENLFESEGESPSSSPQPPFRQSYSELLNNLKQILFEKPPSV
ncbi:Cytosolic Fe-S cluster assembly factor NUBP1 -like protein [Caligus rogercresseyi]|uniref:Cytosolic Fe-S cluster assembly factor NUBP1 -like protein n=1 Tax=Caligus rogercresseyi TaxID=217165 RepID=A0A7T8GPF9_CALRO|nr:Cytosolic Fe-S cluster assembly factor NUBP1 -like protein [Caligus rogercresseyi]